MNRSPLLFETPVPIDWPRRVGPPPFTTRFNAYPARTGPTTKRQPDSVYPNTPEGRRMAQARSWMFPGRYFTFEAVIGPYFERLLAGPLPESVSAVALKVRRAQRAKHTALSRGTSNILDDPNASASTLRA